MKNSILFVQNPFSLLILTILAVLFLSPASVSSQTTDDLRKSIEEAKQQINELQQQLLTTNQEQRSATPTDSPLFQEDFGIGDSGSGVLRLQRALNSIPELSVATSGAGSPGEETTYFGPKTRTAVLKFQNKYAADILEPLDLENATGYFGPSTREKLNEVMRERQAPEVATSTTSPPTELPEDEFTPSTSTDFGLENANEELNDLRAGLTFDKWELTEEEKLKIVETVPESLRAEHFPEYADSATEDLPEDAEELQTDEQSSADNLRKTLAVQQLSKPLGWLKATLASVFGIGQTAHAQVFPVFGGRISAVLPCTCNPPALQVIVAGPRPANVVYMPGVSQNHPPITPYPGPNTIGNYTNFGVCLIGAPPTCFSTQVNGTIILMGQSTI